MAIKCIGGSLLVSILAGFKEGYPYPHAHTLFLMEMGNTPKLLPEQLRAKMVMFTFGNALARAQALYGVRSLHL